MSAGPHLRGDKLPFDPMAFSHITRLVRMPLILAVRNDLPAKTLPEFMALAQKSEIRWASGGIGTSQHLGGELFVQMSGLKMVHVPYRGTGPALMTSRPVWSMPISAIRRRSASSRAARRAPWR
jgi:tripartite-type tricarboxylate transporter receptor subunit TctC